MKTKAKFLLENVKKSLAKKIVRSCLRFDEADNHHKS